MKVNNLNKTQVVVVGAGPVGLTAALALKANNISSVVIEANPKNQEKPGSRAIYLHKATLELLEEIYDGLGFQLAHRGIVWPIKRTLYKGKEVYVRNYGMTNNLSTTTLPPFTSLHQHEIENTLYDACVDSGVKFVWGDPVQKVNITQEGVEVICKSGKKWDSKYVIASDGARSIVREEAGLKLEGPRTHDTFLVVDVEEDEKNPLPLERVFHYKHPSVGGRNVLYVPFKGGWRIDLQLLKDDKVDDFSNIEGVKSWLSKVMDPKYADRITWVSSYRFHQVVANAFTDEHHRVLLAGEAAHLFAPFGARGLNSGVPDAIVATKGIKKALDASTEEERKKFIHHAAKERRIAAIWNRNASSTALHHIQGDSEKMNMKRELAASLAQILPNLGRWLDEGPYGPKYGPPELSTKY